MARPRLTLGCATFEDFDSIYFTVQSWRLHHPHLMKETELVVVDNSPTTEHGRLVKGVMEGWAARGTAGTKYVAIQGAAGTSLTRDKVFREASGRVVVCMDSHVILPTGALDAILDYFEGNPDHVRDIVTGPMLFDDLENYSTHFDEIWRSEMFGIWATAWTCGCPSIKEPVDPAGVQPVVFSPSPSQPEGPQSTMVALSLRPGAIPVSMCGRCGRSIPKNLPWPGHQAKLMEEGFVRLGERGGKPFEIPAMGLGMFAMMKDHWPGFNPHHFGFGGEEVYIHRKVRNLGGKAMCIPDAPWVHKFGRPYGVKYPLTRYNKVRNYVLEWNELGLDLGDIHQHFVASRLMSQADWDHLVADPINHVNPPAAATCGAGAVAPSGLPLPPKEESEGEALFKWTVKTERDLNQHLETIRNYANRCGHVTEFSKRRESLVALATSDAKRVRSYNMEGEDVLAKMVRREGVVSLVGDSPKVDAIEETDLLFIDSQHTKARLAEELRKYGPQVGRYIILHDVMLYGETGEDGGPGLLHAVRDFVRDNPDWSVVFHSPEQYGLMVLSRVASEKPTFPPMWKMAANLAQAVAAHVADGATKVSKLHLEDRLATCDICPARNGVRCSACGCFLGTKAAMKTATCPLDLWKPVDTKHEGKAQ